MTNKNIETFTKVLSALKLDVVTSLARRRFLRLLDPLLTDYNLEMKELQEKYSEKENGKMKVDGIQIIFTSTNRKLFNTEFNKLQNMEMVIDFSKNEEDKKTCVGLIKKEITEFTEKNKDGMDAVSFDYLETLKELITI